MLTKDSDIQKLYHVAKQYVSDITFLDDEIKFLKHIIEKFGHNQLTEDQPVNRVQLINSRFLQLKFIKNNVMKDVLQHQGNITSIINEINVRSFDFLKLENERIENEIKDLNRSFKDIKKEIFGHFKG